MLWTFTTVTNYENCTPEEVADSGVVFQEHTTVIQKEGNTKLSPRNE